MPLIPPSLPGRVSRDHMPMGTTSAAQAKPPQAFLSKMETSLWEHLSRLTPVPATQQQPQWKGTLVQAGFYLQWTWKFE